MMGEKTSALGVLDTGTLLAQLQQPGESEEESSTIWKLNFLSAWQKGVPEMKLS